MTNDNGTRKRREWDGIGRGGPTRIREALMSPGQALQAPSLLIRGGELAKGAGGVSSLGRVCRTCLLVTLNSHTHSSQLTTHNFSFTVRFHGSSLHACICKGPISAP